MFIYFSLSSSFSLDTVSNAFWKSRKIRYPFYPDDWVCLMNSVRSLTFIAVLLSFVKPHCLSWIRLFCWMWYWRSSSRIDSSSLKTWFIIRIGLVSSIDGVLCVDLLRRNNLDEQRCPGNWPVDRIWLKAFVNDFEANLLMSSCWSRSIEIPSGPTALCFDIFIMCSKTVSSEIYVKSFVGNL